METAHTMYGSSRRGGGGAQIKVRRTSGVAAQAGAEEDLAHCKGSAGYIAAHKIGVHGLKPRRRKHAASKDAVTETGSEALNLGFDAIGHVDGRTVGDVAVGP